MKKTMWILLVAVAIAAAFSAFGLVPYEAIYSLSAVPVIGFAALTGDRDTAQRGGEIYSYGVAANAKGYAGGLAALNSSGYAVPASDTAGLRVVGRFEEAFDNTGGANGALTVLVREGVFKFGGSSLTIADVGKPAFVSDDQTISVAVTTNNILAGIVEAVDAATEAWIKCGASVRAGAAQADSTAADVATLKTDFNAFLAKLRAARIIAS